MPRNTAISLPSNFGKNRRFFIGGAVCIWIFSDSTTDFKLNNGKNPKGFFIGGAVYIWVISDSTTDFKLNNGKNPKGFFIGGAVYIWVISDSTSTFASPFSPDKPYRE